MELIFSYSREDALEDGVLLRFEQFLQDKLLGNDQAMVDQAVSALRRDGKAKFSLGELVITRAAAEKLSACDVLNCLTRHQRGDWGECCAEDTSLNNESLAAGQRLFSVFSSHDPDADASVKFYIITEWNREATTVLLPEDY